MSVASSGAGDNRIIFPASADLVVGTAFSVVFWFKSPDNSAGSDFAGLLDNGSTFPLTFNLQMNQAGRVRYFYRDAAQDTATIDSADGFDDDAWHWLFAVKRSNTDHQMYIDRSSIGTDVTDTAPFTPTNRAWEGNGNVLPSGGLIAHAVTYQEAITLAEAEAVAFFGRRGSPASPALWYELLIDEDPQPDWSGNGRNSTSVAANLTTGNHAPITLFTPKWAASNPMMGGSLMVPRRTNTLLRM